MTVCMHLRVRFRATVMALSVNRRNFVNSGDGATEAGTQAGPGQEATEARLLLAFSRLPILLHTPSHPASASPYFFLLPILVDFFFFQTLNFLFWIEVEPTNTAVVVSGEQQRDSVIHMRPCGLRVKKVADSFCSSDIRGNQTVGISFGGIQMMSAVWGLQSPGSSDSC